MRCEKEGRTSSLLTELRSATSQHHRALEDSIDFTSVLSSVDSYRLVIAKFIGIFGILEPRVMAVRDLGCWLPDVNARRRLPQLFADFRALNVLRCRLSFCSDLPEIQNAADALGCLYVLEGSTLGGQIICRQAKQALGLTEKHGLSFFSGDGRDVGAMWKSFVTCLEAFANANPQLRNRITFTAVSTFSSFIHWFQDSDNQDDFAGFTPTEKVSPTGESNPIA